jgi:4-hydroxy-3-methylbut-2-en-1-yl diphosphate synthase IspG/GcpE
LNALQVLAQEVFLGNFRNFAQKACGIGVNASALPHDLDNESMDACLHQVAENLVDSSVGGYKCHRIKSLATNFKSQMTFSICCSGVAHMVMALILQLQHCWAKRQLKPGANFSD